jgi:hypothetical protein
MKTFMLGLVASAAAVPRIELDMAEADTSKYTSCGDSCSTGLSIDDKVQPNGSKVQRRQDYVYTCKANSDTCTLPKAKAWDHNNGQVSVHRRVYLVDEDGATVSTLESDVTGDNLATDPLNHSIDVTKRSKYMIYYDAQDDQGNHAEQVVLELILNDHEKPVITPCQSDSTVQAADCNTGTTFVLCKSTANDNIDDLSEMTEAIKYTIERPDGEFLVTDASYDVARAAMTTTAIDRDAGVENTVGLFTVSMEVQDEAGAYGEGGKNNDGAASFSINFVDTVAPVIACDGEGCTGTDVPATSAFNAASSKLHECATAYDDVTVGGASATDCLDDLTETNLAITSDVSDIDTGAPNTWPKTGKSDTAPYYVKFDVSDRATNAATSVYRKVKVVDTTKPVAALVQPERNQITHSSEEGNALSDPGATCSDTCDKAIPAPTTEWTDLGSSHANAGHADCTEDYVGEAGSGTWVWSCDKRLQSFGNPNELGMAGWDGKKVGEYIRTYTCTDASGNTHSVNRKFIVVDNDQPIITINGSPTETQEATHDREYVDDGATCSDYTNGQLANAVVVDSWNNKDPSTSLSVDYGTAGTYTVSYNCQDLQGNNAPTVYRTILVEDTTCPIVKINGANLLYIEAGFPYKDAGATASDTLDGPTDKTCAPEETKQCIRTDGDTVDVDTHQHDADRPASCEDYRVTSEGQLNDGKYIITTAGTRVEVWCDFGSDANKAFTFYKVQGTTAVVPYTVAGAAASDCSKLGMVMSTDMGAVGSKKANAFASAKTHLGAKWFATGETNLYTCTSDALRSSGRRLGAISSVAGMYVITYHTVDFNGNAECATGTVVGKDSQNKRTVVVKDTLPPVISLHLGTETINQDQINQLSDVGLGTVDQPAQANPAAQDTDVEVDGRLIEANPSLKASPDYVVQANSFPLYHENTPSNFMSNFMAEATTASSNGWVIAGVASAVTGLALLGMSSRRTVATVEV